MFKIFYKIFIILFFAAVLAGFLFWYKSKNQIVIAPITPVVSDYKNLTYIIENQPIELKNGYSEMETAPGSASKIITRYFGNEATGDLNGDGLSDVSFLLTQEAGGSGTFYYIVAVLKTDKEAKPTNTIFLGDRIAPQPIQINNGIIIVNYADRKPGEPMTADPSVGVSRYFKIQNGNLFEQPATNIVFPCYVGGCSGQICSDQKDVVSTCEYREEYACYRTATCERQKDNQCGWTQTSELTACLGK